MTEVTRVPLHPITKGSLTKLWLGVIVAILLGAGIAWASAPKGVSLDTIREGSGSAAKEGDVLFINYVGKLTDGTEFDRSQPLPIPPGILPDGTPFVLEEGQTIPGFYEGLKQVRKGGKYELYIPSDMGYGAEPQPGSPIPPNADLIFEIEVNDILARGDADRRMAALQQMMAQQQGAAGAAEPAAPQGQ
ncbi:FKBP-type peptidyl-prolyl cis-trans isomerase [Altererythrobacter aquiaggeris]|uniref:FKBP-type peptidyl-prolyl cis-trans isomerase n=1 Tax=Aestuarierythrobacter aquiaggeris TaxID=1898396 RepID=UPI00301AD780